MKRGRKFVVSLEEQKQAFSPYKHLFPSVANVPAASDPVFTEIKRALPRPITERGLYLSVKKNFNYIFEVTEQSEDDDSIKHSIGTTQNYEGSSSLRKSQNFEFMIDLYKWETIQPLSKPTNITRNSKTLITQKYRLPKHMWAHLLREEVWKASKTPCSWIFKQYSVKNEDRITCKGVCKQCKALIHIVISWPVDKICHCMCAITNIDVSFTHVPDKKIKLSPVKRVEMSHELKYESAIAYRNELSNELMDTNDIEPPHMPTTGCLRQIKYEKNHSSYYDTNQMISLWIMSYISPYKEAIKQISLRPFYVFYWTHLQETCCKKINKLDRLVLSVDATGSIFKKIGPNNKMLVTKHIFLYVLIMKTQENESSVPVSQMLSDCQTMDIIHQWLQTWSKVNPAPNEINLDDSSALIGAAVKAFTKHDSTAKYVEESYKRLDDGKDSDNTCYIRIDTSHFIKILFNLSCFKHTDVRVKVFYLKCLIELKNCDYYDKAKGIISDLIVLCLNQRDGMNKGGNPSRCENSKNKLKKLSSFRVKDTEIEIEDGDQLNTNFDRSKSLFKDTVCNTTESEKAALCNQKYPQWFYNKIDAERLIITLSDDNDLGTHENLYYFPAFISVLSRLMSQFPLWSNVMKNLYQSNIHKPTSSNVESYFKNLKRLLFKIDTKSHRLRVDAFIMKHLEYLTGELKIAHSNITAPKKK